MRCPITLPPSSCRKLRQHAILQHHVRHVDCSHYQPCSTVPPLMLALFLCRRRLNRTSKLRSIGLRRRSAVTSLTHNHMLMLSSLICCWCCCCCVDDWPLQHSRPLPMWMVCLLHCVWIFSCFTLAVCLVKLWPWLHFLYCCKSTCSSLFMQV